MTEAAVNLNFQLTPTEAIAALRAKTPLSDVEFAALEEKYKGEAFTVAGMEEQELLGVVQDSLSKAMTEGLTERSWEKQVAPMLDAAGFTPVNSYHLATVFYTNLYSAFSAGRYEMAFHPFVKEMLPWFEYRKSLEVECDICDPLDGFTAPKDDGIWDSIYPPNHMNCACGVFSVEAQDEQDSEDDLKAEGWDGVAEGFDHPPTDFMDMESAQEGI